MGVSETLWLDAGRGASCFSGEIPGTAPARMLGLGGEEVWLNGEPIDCMGREGGNDAEGVLKVESGRGEGCCNGELCFTGDAAGFIGLDGGNEAEGLVKVGFGWGICPFTCAGDAEMGFRMGGIC
jgi:hypothetical protein